LINQGDGAKKIIEFFEWGEIGEKSKTAEKKKEKK
jgi:hypothetical protein